MAVLEGIEPSRVMHYFEEICAIPHGSRHNTAVSNYLVDFARAHGLTYWQDAAENVVIRKEATPGYEQAPAVIFQGHMDMVCEKAPGCAKDMDREGLDLVVEGDTVYAAGTTLGGDDGIAVAMALALLEAEDIPHPCLEVVLTTDEEQGMEGASALDTSMLQGRRMLNLDSEAEGVFTVSCAGGNRTTVELPVEREDCPWQHLTVTVTGLVGGHSGTEIHKGRANADLLLGRVLDAAARQTELRLVDVRGGGKDNAIPTAAQAVFCAKEPDGAMDAVQKISAAIRGEYAAVETGLEILCRKAGDGTAMDGESSQRVLTLLLCAPNGVQAMSPELEGLVQTSLNLGILETEEKAVRAHFCLRSSVESQKQLMVRRLERLARQLGGTIGVRGDYPGWAFRQDSPLRQLMVQVFQEQYGTQPRIEALHAGLECGLFAGKLPGLDCISFGPDLTEIHTPREKMHIASVQRTWQLLLEVLRRMKE